LGQEILQHFERREVKPLQVIKEQGELVEHILLLWIQPAGRKMDSGRKVSSPGA